MEYVLVAVEGPLKGCSFPLGGEPCSIGRDACNTVQLVDPSVSRQHCMIRREAGEAFFLSDTDSRNGTFRNGLPATECRLLDGDEIRAGESRFLFLASDSELRGGAVTIEEQEIDPRTIVAIQPEEVVYLKAT